MDTNQFNELSQAIRTRSAIIEAESYVNPEVQAHSTGIHNLETYLDDGESYSKLKQDDVAGTTMFNKLHHVISTARMQLFGKAWHFSNAQRSTFVDFLLKLYMFIVFAGLVGVILLFVKDR